jgi:hypothetical protein
MHSRPYLLNVGTAGVPTLAETKNEAKIKQDAKHTRLTGKTRSVIFVFAHLMFHPAVALSQHLKNVKE